MTQREKLIELLIDSSCCPKETDCEDCEYRENAACREEMIADYLLANGVVVDGCPCDLCAYNPPSSCDGKPCTICPAQKMEGEK